MEKVCKVLWTYLECVLVCVGGRETERVRLRERERDYECATIDLLYVIRGDSFV